MALDKRPFEMLYPAFLASDHRPSVFVDEDFLYDSGIYERVRERVTDAGWPGLLALRSETDVEDTSEFLASLKYIGLGPQDHEGFSYMHRGQQYQTSMNQLRTVFGWPASELRWVLHTPSEQIATWQRITDEAGGLYEAGKSKAVFITDAALYYLHKLICGMFTARKIGDDKPSVYDMTLLKGFDTGDAPDYGHILLSFWEKCSPRGIVMCGGLITYMLRHLHHQPVPRTHRILPPAFLTQTKLTLTRSISARPSTEAIAWVYHPYRPYGQVLPRIRRQAQPHQQQISEQMLYYMFNTTRAIEFLIPGFQRIDPPPGWNPGDPIPPEFAITLPRLAGHPFPPNMPIPHLADASDNNMAIPHPADDSNHDMVTPHSGNNMVIPHPGDDSDNDMVIPHPVDDSYGDMAIPHPTDDGNDDVAIPYLGNDSDNDMAIPHPVDDSYCDMAIPHPTDDSNDDVAIPHPENDSDDDIAIPHPADDSYVMAIPHPTDDGNDDVAIPYLGNDSDNDMAIPHSVDDGYDDDMAVPHPTDDSDNDVAIPLPDDSDGY